VDCDAFRSLVAESQSTLFRSLRRYAVCFLVHAEESLHAGEALTDLSPNQDVLEGFAKRSLRVQDPWYSEIQAKVGMGMLQRALSSSGGLGLFRRAWGPAD